MEWRLLGRVARVVYGNGNPPLRDRVRLCGVNVIAFKVLGMNNTVAIGVQFVLSEASTGEDRESDTECLEVKYSLLQSTVPAAAKIPSTPMARLLLSE